MVIDRDLNAARDLAEMATGAASGAGTGRDSSENAQGEAWHGSGRVASVNCEDGAGPHRPGKTATASPQDEAA